MIEEIITQFKGQTFSSHDEVVAWLKEKLTAFKKSVKEEFLNDPRVKNILLQVQYEEISTGRALEIMKKEL